jgi:hypothetical protein
MFLMLCVVNVKLNLLLTAKTFGPVTIILRNSWVQCYDRAVSLPLRVGTARLRRRMLKLRRVLTKYLFSNDISEVPLPPEDTVFLTPLFWMSVYQVNTFCINTFVVIFTVPRVHEDPPPQ